MTTYASSPDTASHRYPTSVKWGWGYFGDGMRYLIAENDQSALAFGRRKGATLELANVQRLTVSGRWVSCDPVTPQALEQMAKLADRACASAARAEPFVRAYVDKE